MPLFRDSNRVLHKVGTDDAFYAVCYQDVSADPSYFCYVDAEGRWLIMEQNTANGTFKYARGSSDVNTNWGIKGSLTYVIWSELI